ncbi:glycosyltransferase 87 family protein [Jongsikchunia kroppenstedtii]|uniref:glycosyltransferase 87 family protein n=1 Tax=Jongsikchunia kroppenstedtii TaxID=1121721 RepID=UPI003F85C78E
MARAYGVTDERVLGRALGTRAIITRAIATLVFIVSALCRIFGGIHLGGAVLPYRLDLDVYRLGATVWRGGHPLYADHALPITRLDLPLPFTYPPASAVTFVPFSWLPVDIAGLTMSLISIVLLLLVARMAVRICGLDTRLPSRWGLGNWWLAAAITGVAMWLDPVWTTLNFGQVNIILMAMVAVDTLLVPAGRWRGVLTGVAGALKLTPMAFLLHMLVARRWRAAVTAIGAFIAVGAIGFACAPGDSRTYWTHTVFHTDRIGNLAGRNNQNINGFWRRLLADESLAKDLWAVSAVVVTVLAVVAIHRCLRADQSLLALCAAAVWGLLVSPTTWGHHWVWVIPAMVGLAAVGLRTTSSRLRAEYFALVALGLVIFGSSPYQHMADSYTRVHWNLVETIIGNSYAVWGVLMLILLAATVREAGIDCRATSSSDPAVS